MKQKTEAAVKAKPANRPPLPDPGEGRPAVSAGSEAVIHALDAVCKRLDRLIELESRVEALEQGAEGKLEQ